jgi:hypothetical protein
MNEKEKQLEICEKCKIKDTCSNRILVHMEKCKVNDCDYYCESTDREKQIEEITEKAVRKDGDVTMCDLLDKEEYQNDFCNQFNKGYKKGSKETAKEILKKGNEYLMQSTDKACAFACFLGIIEYEYGVEIKEN